MIETELEKGVHMEDLRRYALFVMTYYWLHMPSLWFQTSRVQSKFYHMIFSALIT